MNQSCLFRFQEGGHSPKLLQRAVIEISNQDYCKDIYRKTFVMEVDDTQVCADVPEGGKGSCHVSIKYHKGLLNPVNETSILEKSHHSWKI